MPYPNTYESDEKTLAALAQTDRGDEYWTRVWQADAYFGFPKYQISQGMYEWEGIERPAFNFWNGDHPAVSGDFETVWAAFIEFTDRIWPT